MVEDVDKFAKKYHCQNRFLYVFFFLIAFLWNKIIETWEMIFQFASKDRISANLLDFIFVAIAFI